MLLWDLWWYEVWFIGVLIIEEKEWYFLWCFWKWLFVCGEINVFDCIWYGCVLVEWVEGYCSEVEWKCVFDEINEFEV